MEDEIFYVIQIDNGKYIYFDYGFDCGFDLPYPNVNESTDITSCIIGYNYSETKKIFNLLKRKELNSDERNELDSDEDLNIRYKGKVKNIIKITLQKEIVEGE